MPHLCGSAHVVWWMGPGLEANIGRAARLPEPVPTHLPRISPLLPAKGVVA